MNPDSTGGGLKLKQASVVLDVMPKDLQNLVQFKVVRPVRRGRAYWFDNDALLQAKCAIYLKQALGASTKYVTAFIRALALSPAWARSPATIRFDARPRPGQAPIAVIVPLKRLRQEVEARLPLVAVAKDLPPGRRRPGWKAEFLRSLHEAARELSPLTDAQITKVVRDSRRARTRPEIAVAAKA
jgi:hypothetical protein